MVTMYILHWQRKARPCDRMFAYCSHSVIYFCIMIVHKWFFSLYISTSCRRGYSIIKEWVGGRVSGSENTLQSLISVTVMDVDAYIAFIYSMRDQFLRFYRRVLFHNILHAQPIVVAIIDYYSALIDKNLRDAHGVEEVEEIMEDDSFMYRLALPNLVLLFIDTNSVNVNWRRLIRRRRRRAAGKENRLPSFLSQQLAAYRTTHV